MTKELGWLQEKEKLISIIQGSTGLYDILCEYYTGKAIHIGLI